jgi:hypothetical protein
MMLLVLLATALSASAAPADSVRVAAKPGSVRPDTTLSTLPVPAIVTPRQPAPEVVGPIPPVTAVAHLGLPASNEAPSPASTDAGRGVEVVQQARVATPAPVVSDARETIVTAASAPQLSLRPAPVVASLAPAPTPSASVAPEVPKAPVMAPADAIATAAAPAAAPVTSTRVDPRTVVSVRSSERIEPLYTVPIPAAGIRVPPPAIADSIVVYKRERTLMLFYRGVPVKSYFIALGSEPIGDKLRKGDNRTPEGIFHINAHNPASKFHLALRISYPDDVHRVRAAAAGVDPGGDIMIHGLPKEYSEAGKAHRQNDWTNGCVALSNQEIEEVWRAVPDGTPVHIKP